MNNTHAHAHTHTHTHTHTLYDRDLEVLKTKVLHVGKENEGGEIVEGEERQETQRGRRRDKGNVIR